MTYLQKSVIDRLGKFGIKAEDAETFLGDSITDSLKGAVVVYYTDNSDCGMTMYYYLLPGEHGEWVSQAGTAAVDIAVVKESDLLLFALKQQSDYNRDCK